MTRPARIDLRRASRPALLGVLALLGLLALITAPEPAAAQEADAGDAEETPGELAGVQDAPRGVTSLADIGFGIERAVGLRPVQEFFFPGPGDFTLAPQGSQLVLRLSHSNLLVPDISTVTVLLNAAPLRVIPLDESNVEATAYAIPVPNDVIAQDFNRLTLEYRLDMGVDCGDPFHPALFAALHPESRLELRFAEDPPVPRLREPNLVEYPYPFFRGGYPLVAPVTIVIPDMPIEAELTAAYRIAADLATRASFDLEQLDVRQVGQLTATERAAHQLIVVGELERQPLAAAIVQRSTFVERDGEVTRGSAQLAADHGMLSLTSSPWNPDLRSLLISGQSSEAVGRAVDAITSAEPSALFAGPEAVLTEPVAAPGGQPDEFASLFTFADVGFGDVTLTGTGERAADVLFTAPALAPGSTAQLDLVVSTPETLDRRRSNVLVELNGSAVATIELQDDEMHRAAYRVALPADAMQVGPNTLRLRATLYALASNFGACESSAAERVWATLHGDSAIALPEAGPEDSGTAQAVSLASLPYPFAGQSGIRATTFVIDPDSHASLRGGMLSAISLGRRANARHDFEVVSYKQANELALGDRHIVAVGIPPGSELATQLSSVLPLVFSEDGSRALVEEEGGVLTEILDASRLSAIQEAPVPWARSRTLLAVTATDEQALAWATSALTGGGLDGNVALLQSPLSVQTFTLERTTDEPAQQQLEERFTPEESRERTVAGFLLLGGAAGALLVLWAARRRLPFRPF